MDTLLKGIDEIDQNSHSYIIRKGEVIKLLVGKNRRNGGPMFVPEFNKYDLYTDGRTVRFFNPINKAGKLKFGEEWIVKILSIKHYPEKEVDGGYELVYIKVKVIKRAVEIERGYYNNGVIDKKWVTKVTSGYRVIKNLEQPAERKQAVFIKGDTIYSTTEIWVNHRLHERRLNYKESAVDHICSLVALHDLNIKTTQALSNLKSRTPIYPGPFPPSTHAHL